MDILLPEKVMRIANDHRIQNSDIEQTVFSAEKSGQKIIRKSSGRYVAHRVCGHITLWVEYQVANGVCTVETIYYHRMEIESMGEGHEKCT